jgi:PIN domain nuclease of toxin-antitoxin system
VKLLLDTCTALWVAIDAPELSRQARGLFEETDNEVYLSAVSVWEISLKYALGKLPLPRTPDVLVPELRRNGRIEALPLDEAAALQLFRLPPLHTDPFDRMLVCQAIVGGMVILTPDPDIRRYPVRTAW